MTTGQFRVLLVPFMAIAIPAWHPATSAADEPIALKESFAAGYQYHVSTRTELSGTLQLPPEKGRISGRQLSVTGTSAIEYDERVLHLSREGDVDKTIRIYRRIDFKRKVGDEPQEATIRPAVRRLIVLRQGHVEVPFSPDGPLMWGELDQVRTDVFTPALTGLLPPRPVRPGDRWTAVSGAIQELTDLERIEEGKVECRLEEIASLEGRRHARIRFAGTVRGVNEDGPNRQELDGYFFFDLQSNHVSYLSLRGLETLLDKDGKETGRIQGQFVLTRQAHQQARDLSEEAIKSVVLEPNDDNTLLLYENPTLGVRFMYPRRWRVGGARGSQVTVDEAEGSGLLLTIDAAGRVPSGRDFEAETRAYWKQQNAKVNGGEPVRRLQGPPRELDRFSLNAEVGGKRVIMEYYVARQADGGATLAARLVPEDLAKRQREVQRIAESLVFFRPAVQAGRR